MTAPTHIALSAVAYFYLCIVFRIPLAFGDAFLCAIAALLPDIDISSSGIGWRLKFLSSWIEKKFGHRTITHSFLGVFIVSLLSLPLLFMGIPAYSMFVIGYFSHPLLDMFNKEGVQIYWPNAKWGVFPSQDEHRIEVGSNAENVLLVGFIVLAILLYPIASVGLDRTLHWMLADMSGAVKDYNAFSPNYKLNAELEGTYRKIDTKVKGTYQVLDALSEHSLLLEIDGKLRIVGISTDAHIVPSSIRIKKGKKISRYTQSLSMDGHTFGELFRLENVEHRMFGVLKAMSYFDIPQGVVFFNTITKLGSVLTLDHATYADIKEMGLENIPVLASNLLVEVILPPDSLFKEFSFLQGTAGVFRIEVPISAKEDVQISPGHPLKRGDILVANSEKLREITLAESQLETERKLRQQQSFEFSVHHIEQEQNIGAVDEEISDLKTKLKTYQKSLGFEKEIGKLQHSIEELEAKKSSLLNKKKELGSKDSSDRLHYEQKIAELLSKKEALEVSAITKAEFDMEIVSIEFQQSKCILYLRRLN